MEKYLESKIIIPFLNEIGPQNLEKIADIIKQTTNVSPDIYIAKNDQLLCKYNFVFSVNVFIRTEDIVEKLLKQIYDIVKTEIYLNSYENEVLLFHFTYNKDDFTFEEYRKYF